MKHVISFKMIPSETGLTSDEGQARVEVEALRQGAPVPGRHLPPVANGKVFKAMLHLRLGRTVHKDKNERRFIGTADVHL